MGAQEVEETEREDDNTEEHDGRDSKKDHHGPTQPALAEERGQAHCPLCVRRHLIELASYVLRMMLIIVTILLSSAASDADVYSDDGSESRAV